MSRQFKLQYYPVFIVKAIPSLQVHIYLVKQDRTDIDFFHKKIAIQHILPNNYGIVPGVEL